MKVVGLISGGKDSIWNLHYCKEFGHEVVCVANLSPPHGVDELDSYMYQTVGSDVIDAIAAALELPLIRRVIAGEPKETSSQTYLPRDGDEVEDLTLLLRDVLKAHPDVQAVSCGAILSNYQRLRVEDVCARLGLKVLAFMWKQEQPDLLQQMINGELDARIVKVASMGLNRKHVGRSILDPTFADYLFGLGKKWGVHVCGEGGEYETSVADAPMYRKKINFKTTNIVDHPDKTDDVAWLQVKEAVLEEKSADAISAEAPFEALAHFSDLRYYHRTFPFIGATAAEEVAELRPSDWHPRIDTSSASTVAPQPVVVSSKRPTLTRITKSIWSTSSLDVQSFDLWKPGDTISPEDQCDTLLAAISRWLGQQQAFGGTWSLRSAVMAEVQVRDLGSFEAVNAVYARYFNMDPPPRICIETMLPEGVHVRLRLWMRAGRNCQVVHLRVQSISTWAMACIGPYSQAAQVDESLLTAGVLGLVPHTMVYPTGRQALTALAAEADGEQSQITQVQDWEAELWILMRSLWRVVVEMNFSAVCTAQIYVAPAAIAAATKVEDRVRSYLARESPTAAAAAPLFTCTVVPKLPRGGLVEVNVLCAGPDDPIPEPCECVESPTPSSCPFPGTLITKFRRGAGKAWFAVGEIRIANGATAPSQLLAESLPVLVDSCVKEVWTGLRKRQGEVGPGGVSLLTQFSMEGADDVLPAVVAQALVGLWGSGNTVVSYMRVVGMPAGALLRFTAFSGND